VCRASSAARPLVLCAVVTILLRSRDCGEDLLHPLSLDPPVAVELGVHDGAADVHFERAGFFRRRCGRRFRGRELRLDGVLHRRPLGGVNGAWRDGT
jgi:hypothetical protein